ncbi:MAG: branched-chain amino acid ABC transporter permease [Fervidicoccaceae archaeon]
MLNIFLQVIINGILVSGIYALAASGLSLIFGVMGVANAAHASLAIFSAYITYTLQTSLGINPLYGMIITGILFFGLGIVLYRFLVSKVEELMAFTLLYMFSIFITNSIVFIWSNLYRQINVPQLSGSFLLGGLYLPKDRTVTFLIAISTILMIAYVLKATYFGKAVRATMQNPIGASLMGINVSRIKLYVFGIGIFLSAIAGVMMGIIYAFSPTFGDIWIGLLFAIVVFGGLGSLTGTFIASLIIGIATSLTSAYLSSVWAPLIAFIILILTLWIKPTGLMGKMLK